MGFYNTGGAIADLSQIVSTTKPTTRDNGDALETGDRWYNSDDGTSWFWNGTYWLSVPIYSGGGNTNVVSATGNVPTPYGRYSPVIPGYDIFLQDLFVNYEIDTADVSNYWDLGVAIWRTSATGNHTSLNNNTILVNSPSAGVLTKTETAINTAILATEGNSTPFAISGYTRKTGSPANVAGFDARITYRLIAP